MGTGKPVGRPSKKLENHRDWITEQHNAEVTIDEILIELQMTHNLEVGRSTLLRQLGAWNLRSRRPQWEDSPALRMRVKHCFDRLQLTDEAAQVELLKHGYDLHPSRIAKLRKEMGMYKRTGEKQRPVVKSNLEEIIRKEYENEEMRNMSMKALHKYLKAKYNINGRDLVYEVSRKIDPEGQARRLKLQMKNTRQKQLEKQNQNGLQPAEQTEQFAAPAASAPASQYALSHVLDPALAANAVANFDPALTYSQHYAYPEPFT